jgi:hypothetical protein
VGDDDQARTARGPFLASQLRPGDRYELSRGHAIWCAPAGGDGSRRVLRGAAVLATDPAVTEAGIDIGYSNEPGQLRAPDVAIGNVPDAPGWIAGVPPLAVEYAGRGQDEADLQAKIGELLAGGTRWVWVVRLIGPRRVEVFEKGQPVRVVGAGERLTAPGVLQNDVPVEALWDGEVADAQTLRNLLQRHGYADLGAVRAEGREEGRVTQARAALRRVLARRGLVPTSDEEARIDACTSTDVLERWHDRAIDAETVAAVLAP